MGVVSFVTSNDIFLDFASNVFFSVRILYKLENNFQGRSCRGGHGLSVFCREPYDNRRGADYAHHIATGSPWFLDLLCAASDFILFPNMKVGFSLTLNLLHLQMEFVSIFQEGKELAEQSEILEQPHAGSLNPDDIYYGQGMWPDRVGQTNNDENAAAQWLRLGITACDPNLAIALANFISSEKIELQPLDEWIKKIVNCLKRWESFK